MTLTQTLRGMAQYLSATADPIDRERWAMTLRDTADALATAQAERDAALQRAERLRSDLTTGQLHAPECPYTTADEDGTTCTCPPEQLAARWKAQWVLMKQRAEQAEALALMTAANGIHEEHALRDRAERAEAALAVEREKHDEDAYNDMREAKEQAEAALAQAQAALVPFARLCHADGIELPDLSCDPHEWREAIAHAEAAHQRRQQAGE